MQWHELDEETYQRLATPVIEAVADQVIATVLGDDFEPVALNFDLWRRKVLREGLGSWWSFDVTAKLGEPVHLNVYFWDLHAVITHEHRVRAGHSAIARFEARLAALRREWGIVDEEEVERLVSLPLAPAQRRRPSALAGRLESTPSGSQPNRRPPQATLSVARSARPLKRPRADFIAVW